MSADIRSMTLEELTEALGEMGEPAFRGRQVFAWLHRGVRSFHEMSDISKSLREKLGVRALLKLISAHTLTVFRLNSPLESLELGKDVRGILGYLHFS